MTHLSPSVFLVWALISTFLCSFYLHHMWKFDRFRCLNLTRGDSGAFKRFMTYSYLLTIPMLMLYTMGFTIIKYREGFTVLPSGAVFPKPHDSWTPQHQAVIFPLCLAWSLTWGGEVVSHLEELCFWLYLIHAGPSPVPWFKSIYFRLWMAGSICAVILMLTVTTVTRHDPLRNEAWLQFVGSVLSLLITIGFLPILWVFPNFVQTVKNEGAGMEAVIRLAKFHELNIIRIFFRFLFVIPPFILAIDGIQPHTHTLSESMFLTDLLSIASGIGCVVQSVITLMIFFPRNVEVEIQRWIRETPVTSRRFSVRVGIPLPGLNKYKQNMVSNSRPDPSRQKYLLSDSPVSSKVELSGVRLPFQPYSEPPSSYRGSSQLPLQSWDSQYATTPLDLPLAERNVGYSTVNGSALGLTESGWGAYEVNPLALNFTSPIDLRDGPRRSTVQY